MPKTSNLAKRHTKKWVLIQSGAGGVLIPVFVLLIALVVGNSVEKPLDNALLGILFDLIGWPILLLGRFEPSSGDFSERATHIREAVLAGEVLLDFMAYAFLTFVILWWRRRRALTRNENSCELKDPQNA